MSKRFKLFLKKIKSKAGFSLVEMLFSILILMLSTSVIIQCFGLGMGNFIKVTRSSEGQLLCTALTSSIQNELTYAKDIDGSGTSFTYFSMARKLGEECSIVVENNEVVIKSAAGTTYPMVSKASYTGSNRKGYSAEYFLIPDLEISWDDSSRKFHVNLTINDKDGNEQANSEFYVTPIG